MSISTIRRRSGNRTLMLVENNSYPQDTRVRSEAEALRSAGYQVAVISPAARGQAWREVIDGVYVYRFPAPFEARGFLGYLWEYGYATAAIFVLSMLVWAREGFDVIHAANPPETLVFVAAFHKLFGKRFIFDHHDLSPEMYRANFGQGGNRFVHGVLVWLEKLSCRVSDHVIATNQSYKQMEMERAGVPSERITVVRNGPHLSRFCPTEPDADLRSAGKAVIAYVGSMGPHDGIDYLLRALKCLVYDLARTDFVCVLMGGRGEILEELKTLATTLGLDGYVRFTGWIAESHVLRQYLSSADICVVPDPSNPYNDRSTMIKMAEYMALSKPIVAFDLPENRFTAQDAALFVRANDEMEFARAMARLMDDSLLRQAKGAFGRRRVEAELAWPYSVHHLLSVYQAVLPEARTSLLTENLDVSHPQGC
jgi:glycosyltransferase involved in cell wall biosynthesis